MGTNGDEWHPPRGGTYRVIHGYAGTGSGDRVIHGQPGQVAVIGEPKKATSPVAFAFPTCPACPGVP